MSTSPSTTNTTAEIVMGRGLAAPDRAVTREPEAGTTEVGHGHTSWRRVALAGAALVSPVALALQYALNTAGLPRQEAGVYLGAVAAHRSLMVASTIAYTVGMATLVAAGALAAIVLRRQAPVASAVSATLLTLGAIGGGAFVSLRLAALAFTEDGGVVPGGVEAFVRLQDAIITPVGLLLVSAILGTFTLAVAMYRSRRLIGWWPGVVTVAGFVLASGEFPNAVSVIGALLQGTALVPLARLTVAKR